MNPNPARASQANLSEVKRSRLRALSTPAGVIAALALDQRKSLRQMMAETAGIEPLQIPDTRTRPRIALQTIRNSPWSSASVTSAPGQGCRFSLSPWYRAADSVARRPYIYLSAGVNIRQFIESLRLAAEAGARFSGVLCGRANWQDGVPAFMSGGRSALDSWFCGEVVP